MLLAHSLAGACSAAVVWILAGYRTAGVYLMAWLASAMLLTLLTSLIGGDTERPWR